jgi:hypothetical protein
VDRGTDRDRVQAISTAAGIAGWWDKPTAVKSDSGVVLEFNPGPEHGVLRAKVLAAIRDQRVEWEFVSTHPKNSPAFARNTGQLRITRRAVPPWAAERADTIVDFRHSGWDERSERAA